MLLLPLLLPGIWILNIFFFYNFVHLITDPFSQQWMEDTSWAQLLDIIPTEPSSEQVAPANERPKTEQLAPATERPKTELGPSNEQSKAGQLSPSDEQSKPRQLGPSSEDYGNFAINLLAQILETNETLYRQNQCNMQEQEKRTSNADIDLNPVISLDTSQDVGEISEIFLQDDCDILGSPLSAEDVESLLSGSEPSSPGTSAPPTPVAKPISDLEKLLTSDTPISSIPQVKTTTGRCGRPKIKTVSDTCDINMEFLSKKEKKKIQNKNAAIRYRMKKKVESETIKSEENQLEEKNKTLKDKVEQLQREIQYMKNLMDEVRNAKQLKSSS